MNILKISQSDDQIAISYEERTGDGGKNTIAMSSKDLPRPEFSEAMRAVKPVFKRLTEMSHEYASDFNVDKLAFNFSPTGNKTVRITASRIMEEGDPLKITTPPRLMDSLDNRKGMIKTDDVIAIEELESEARRYIGGDRQQQELCLAEEEAEQREIEIEKAEQAEIEAAAEGELL